MGELAALGRILLKTLKPFPRSLPSVPFHRELTLSKFGGSFFGRSAGRRKVAGPGAGTGHREPGLGRGRKTGCVKTMFDGT